ncbi:MAG: matrixin family metalloprotease [Polyangiaceae bacterium]|jgi:MYXO-CTERM domain-containing protein
MRGRAAVVVAACLAATGFAGVAGEREARAFCRTTTCPLPPEFAPSPAGCQPADFAQYCASLDPPVQPLAVWWSNACVSYDIQQNASRQVPYATAVQSFATAFSKWTSVTCAGGTRTVSISVTNLGPVECDLVQYSSDQGNQHVIIFHDDSWPYDDPNNTLGLTTITFDPSSGEIYDADMEINSTQPLTVSGPLPAEGYDFMSIITHETGHFFGMAHSGDDLATMYAHYTPGTTTMRTLTTDDTTGICSIYPPDGTRDVATSVSASGTIAEDACDPTPRHGFQSQCAQPQSKGCAAAPGDPKTGPVAWIVAAAMLAAGARRGRRRRRSPTVTWV